MTVTIVVDICFPSAATESELGLRRGDLGLLAFVLSMGFVAALRLVRMKTDLARARMNVLLLREEDVHPGARRPRRHRAMAERDEAQA